MHYARLDVDLTIKNIVTQRIRHDVRLIQFIFVSIVSYADALYHTCQSKLFILK